MSPELSPNGYPHNPVLLRLWRGGRIESVHRGSWVLVDGSGQVLVGDGAHDQPFFARSSIKAIQALPLFETGAAERFDFGPEELALALASHNGERCHTDVVRRTLKRLELDEGDLRCGAQPPGDSTARQELRESGLAPGPIHNNCSGKHAGFLALARHLGTPIEDYLDPRSQGQRLVREALGELCDLDPAGLDPAIDGCSAPTYAFGLSSLATAFARLTNPEGLRAELRAPCRLMSAAVARHPVLIAGTQKRLCTDLARVTQGRIFPKIGAEAVYAVGIRGEDRGLAVKIDDGSLRAVNALVPALLDELGFLSPDEVRALEPWTERRIHNRAGLLVGRIEPVLAR